MKALEILTSLILLGPCGFAGAAEHRALEPMSSPEDRVIDLRLFEARAVNPDYDALADLSYLINSDGRDVTANQWLGTVASGVPGSFLAAIAYRTNRLDRNRARFEWLHRSRSLQVDIDLSSYDPSRPFDAAFQITMKRDGETLRRFTRTVPLAVGRTTVWSAPELELEMSDYLSGFRGYENSNERGLIFEKMQMYAVHLIVAATPRLLAADEAAQLSPERLQRPPDEPLPIIDNPLGAPLKGTVVVGFEIDSSGSPRNPQVIWSTVPEVNPRILGEAARWRFPPPIQRSTRRRWGQVEVEIDIR